MEKSVCVSRTDHLMARKAWRCFSRWRCWISSVAKEVWFAAAFAAARFSNHSSLRSDPLWGFLRALYLEKASDNSDLISCME